MLRRDTKLSQLVEEKTKYIPDNLYYEALAVTKKDVQANRESAGTWEFDTWSKDKQLQYIADAMAVYVILERRVSK